MAQYGWPDCPREVREQLARVVDAFHAALGANLAGIYLHGSLAMGCFNPERSDVDLLVVTERAMRPEEKRAVAIALLEHSAAPRPIEISFVARHYLHDPQFPPPFDFHYSEDWRPLISAALEDGRWRAWNDELDRDPDLPAHFMIVTRRGIVLYGAPIAAIFPRVRHEAYVASILADVPFAVERIEEDPVYAVLNLCRVYRYLLEGEITSKDEAGAWATHALPDEHRQIVAAALAAYRGADEPSLVEMSGLHRFAAYMEARIEAPG